MQLLYCPIMLAGLVNFNYILSYCLFRKTKTEYRTGVNTSVSHSAISRTKLLCSVVKRPMCEVDHSAPTSADIKNTWIYSSTLP
jgi:hypothetical protein